MESTLFLPLEDLCVPSENNVNYFLNLLAKLYDDSNKVLDKPFGLLNLQTCELDAESVWQQLQSRNKPLNRYLKKKLTQLHHCVLQNQTNRDESNHHSDVVGKEDFGEEDETFEESDHSDAEFEYNGTRGSEEEQIGEDEEENSEGEEESEAETLSNFSEMEGYLDEMDQIEDERATRPKKQKVMGHKGAVEEESEDEEEFVQRELYKDDNDDPTEQIMFADFFGDKKDSGKTKSSHIASKHSKSKKRIDEEISQLEQELVKPKSWELRGEVKGADRPENSLLNISADIERALKPAPVVTEEYTSTLEEMICKRIQEESFDDVVVLRKKELTTATDEAADLSQEKSSVGLGEIYASDFLLKAMEADSKAGDLDQTRELIKGLFHKICRQLDALSHFHFTPKPVVAEAAVKSEQLPVISMEDIAPSLTHVNVISNLAPEEIKERPRGRDASLKTEEETTSLERQRRRRASKASKRKENLSLKAENQRVLRENPSSSQASGLRQKETVDILTRDRRVTMLQSSPNTSGSSKRQDYSNSADFFSKLQREVQDDLKLKSGETKVTSRGEKRKRDRPEDYKL